MGTNGDKMKKTEKNRNTSKLQNEIKGKLRLIDWSIPKFASTYLIERTDWDVPENEIISFVEKIKKQLSRHTTNSELLNNYLRYIEKTNDYSKLIER